MSADLTVPPLPVVAWLSSGDWTLDANEADFWLADPTRTVEPLVRKADADAAIASLQARLDAAERALRSAKLGIESQTSEEWAEMNSHHPLLWKALREVNAALAASQEGK